MPIPAVLAQVAFPEGISAPVPVPWNRTNVTLTGGNGKGSTIDLTGFSSSAWPGVFMLPGATGLDMPPFMLSSDESPNLDGAIFRAARASAREIMLPVYLHGIDRQTVNGLKRRFFQALNPKRGYCHISFTEGDGTPRRIAAYYKGGMEGSESTDSAGFTWVKYGLTFTAMDPWFYSDRDQSKRWDFGSGNPLVSTVQKFFPMAISAGVIGGSGSSLVISNPGDIEAWPVWKLSGPIKSFSLQSPFGELIKASAPTDGSDLVPTGRTLTIDTRPGKKTVRDNAGVNYWAKLDTNPQFWSVEPGDSECNISVVTGAGKAAVVLSFSPRYASYI